MGHFGDAQEQCTRTQIREPSGSVLVFVAMTMAGIILGPSTFLRRVAERAAALPVAMNAIVAV